jgi:hypothetical protein
MAITHLAIYDAVNAIDGSHKPYIPIGLSPSVTAKANVEAAVAKACRDTLAVLYSNQLSFIDEQYDEAQKGFGTAEGCVAGITVGAKAAANILERRSTDGYADGDTMIYPPATERQHQPDPINPDQGLLTPGWGHLKTFSAIDVTAPSVRAPAPPPAWDPDYTKSFLDVLKVGGDGITTPTKRTAEETEIGIFWAYDGSPKLGTPPRLYNQVIRRIAKLQHNTLVQNARLFALANIAMADSGIACWDSKYYHDLWRPIIGIRQADDVFNCELVNVADWSPLGAPLSNSIGPNFTPPFPAYPSGHATFGGAVFRTLRHFYGTDDVAFRLKSDELKDTTTDNQGNPRPNVTRRYESFTQAARENARSRIYLGVHWQFDADAGIDQGTKIADHICQTLLKPLH